MAKKYLDEVGLKKYTELIKGEVNNTANALQASIDLKANQTDLNSKVDNTEYNNEIDKIYKEIADVNILASNLDFKFSATTYVTASEEDTNGESVTTTVTLTGKFEKADVTSVKINTTGQDDDNYTTLNIDSAAEITGGYKWTLNDTVKLAAGGSKTYRGKATVKGVEFDKKSATTYAYYDIHSFVTNFLDTDGQLDFTKLNGKTFDGMANAENPQIVNHNTKTSSSANGSYTWDITSSSSVAQSARCFLFIPTGNTAGNVTTIPTKFSRGGFDFIMLKHNATVEVDGIKYTVFYTPNKYTNQKFDGVTAS